MSILASIAQTPVTNSGNDTALAWALAVIFAALVIGSIIVAHRDAAERHRNETQEEYE